MAASDLTVFDRKYGIKSLIETLGGSGVIHLFVHNLAALGDRAELVTALPGFSKYAERALVIARPDDVVCVLEKVDARYLQFLSYLRVGPRQQNIIVASENVQPHPNASLSDVLIHNSTALFTIRNLIDQDKQIILNPYMVSAKEFQLASALNAVVGREVSVLGGDLRIVEYANYKHNVRAQALELQVPVPEGEVVELEWQQQGLRDLTPLYAAIDRHIRRTGKAIIKGTRGFSGSSTIIIEDHAEKERRALRKVTAGTGNTIYLVEVMLNVTVSPNILMYIEADNGRISCVGVTDQLLREDLVHEGNVYPSRAKTLPDMLSSAQKVSRWLQTQGYWGLVGFDFAEYVNPTTGQCEYFLAEVNPRTNAAVYPKALMEQLNRRQEQEGRPSIEAFLAANVETKVRSFAELARLSEHLFFDPQAGRGIVPYNTGCLENGKCSLAIFGKGRDEVARIYKDCKASLAGDMVLPGHRPRDWPSIL